MEKNDSIELVEDNRPTETEKYISFEENSGLSDFGTYFGKCIYGAVASMYRFPTLIRKIINKQCIWHRDATNSAESGGIVGGIAGIVLDGYLLFYSAATASEGNYAPLAVLVGANLVSLGFELNRFPKSKQEHLEMRARIEAEKNHGGLEAEVQIPQATELRDETTGA